MHERLRRYEMVDSGDNWHPYQELEEVKPHDGQVFDACDEFCRAEDVAKLEATVETQARRIQELERARFANSGDGAIPDLLDEVSDE